MNIWRDIFRGFTEGILTAAVDHANAASLVAGDCERGRIERLCRELGWSVDERQGSAILLHFGSSAGGTRKVRISDGDEAVVMFSACCLAVVPAGLLPAEALAYLLRRNVSGSGIGMWGIHVNAEENVTFHLMYQALGRGLDAPTLKFICESVANEAAALEDKMREARLLR